MPWEKRNPDLSNDPAYLEPRLNDLDAQLAENANKLPDSIYIKSYGIKTRQQDPAFDCLPSLIQAINEANTRGGKVKIVFPEGEFNFGVAVGIPSILGRNILISGQGEEITKLCLTSGTYFTWGNDVDLYEEGGLSDLTIHYDVPDPMNPTVLTKYISGQQWRNLKLYNVCTFMQCGTDTVKTYSQRFTNVRVAVANQGKPLIKLVNGAGFYWEDGTGGFVSGVLPPVGQDDMTTVPGTDFVLVEGNWDTLRLNNFIERFYRGVYLKADVGKTILNVFINNSLYDYIREKAIDIYANGGTIATVMINNPSFNSWENHCVHIHSTGFCQGIEINNPYVIFSGGSGIQFDGNVSKFKIINPKVKGCSRKVAGTDGIVMGSNIVDFLVEGGEVGGSEAATGITWGEKIGIALLGNNDIFSIRGLKSFRFQIANPSTSAQADASKKRQCKDNLWSGNEAGFNYAGAKTAGIFVLPTSGTQWFNTTPYDVEIHVWGGTIQELSKNSALLMNPLGSSFTLRPGENYAIYYTAAPNVSYFVRQ